ncbi:retrovirus-related pol polyprotein from transposon TNT 1-94 [Tanacetum coccineum]
MLSSFLISNNFSKGLVDPTLFIRREGKELLLVQIYADDIIFAASTPELCDLFAKIMCLKFKMSMMGKISFFLGLQISQSPRGIFINQSKYALESLKKYGFESCDPVDTPMVEKSKLDEDKEGKAVDPSHYRGMIDTLLYLTASRPDLQFAICMCARYQARPTKKHLNAVKRIFQYLKGTIHRGLWYLKDSSFALTTFADADHAGCQDTRRSTSGSIQLLGDRLSFRRDHNLPTMALDSIKFQCTMITKALLPYAATTTTFTTIPDTKHIDIRFSLHQGACLENGVIDFTLSIGQRLSKLGEKVEAMPKSAWTEKDQINNFLKERRYDESNTYVLERFNTTAGNHVKNILLKLNLSDPPVDPSRI